MASLIDILIGSWECTWLHLVGNRYISISIQANEASQKTST